MIIGLLTDVFDGIIARKTGVSTKRLRLLDSNVDQFFWLLTISSVFIFHFSFLKNHYLFILIVMLLEAVTYLVGYFKFKKSIATHSLLAKFWAISLLAFLIDLTLSGSSHWIFISCVTIGIVSRFEIILIIVTLKNWTTDIPSILSVSKVNRGKEIKRYKLFNG